MDIAGNLASIRQKLSGTKVKIVAVSKSVGLEEIELAYKEGVTEFGENRIQDALEKQDSMPPHMEKAINWHFIGHLQSNKAKKAVGQFALIHSVDSLKLAQALSEQAVKRGLEQQVLLQVKILEDREKGGFEVDELKSGFAQLLSLSGIKIQGLMTMTPLTEDKKLRKTCFLGLQKLRQELEKEHGSILPELSMGMSDDFLEAVECGATIVRIGRGIFQKSEN